MSTGIPVNPNNTPWTSSARAKSSRLKVLYLYEEKAELVAGKANPHDSISSASFLSGLARKNTGHTRLFATVNSTCAAEMPSQSMISGENKGVGSSGEIFAQYALDFKAGRQLTPGPALISPVKSVGTIILRKITEFQTDTML